VLGALDEHVRRDGHLVLLCHPFLLPARPDTVAEVLARVGELGRAGDLRCVRMDEVAGTSTAH
jgi:hypothetical protein